MAVSNCPCSTFTNAMFTQMPRSHWFLSINSQYLQPYWLLQQTSQHTKPQRYKATKIHTLTPLTYKLFFQNSSTITRPYKQIIELNEQLQSLKIYIAINIIYTHILRVKLVLLLNLPITEQNNYLGCQLQFQVKYKYLGGVPLRSACLKKKLSFFLVGAHDNFKYNIPQ